MKIKTLPEDFIVKEALSPDLSFREKGDFAFYLLEKRGYNTADAVTEIARRLRVPRDRCAYGGRKDRHASTVQHISIRAKTRPRDIRHGRLALRFLGFLDRPMGPDLISGNYFVITARGLDGKNLHVAARQIPKILSSGYPNYFDDQRFGSYDKTQGFLAEKILRSHYNGALKIRLTRLTSKDKKKDKDRKKFFFERWGDWQACLGVAELPVEKDAFRHLAAHPRDFLAPLRLIPRDELAMFFSAYQAFLWNETLKVLLKKYIRTPLARREGRTGDYLFYDDLSGEELSFLKNLTIPTAASKMDFTHPDTQAAAQAVFERHHLKKPMFNITKLRQAYFKSTQRPAIVLPQDFYSLPADDELDPGSKKLTLRFFLPRGSYGTMLIKRLSSNSLT